MSLSSSRFLSSGNIPAEDVEAEKARVPRAQIALCKYLNLDESKNKDKMPKIALLHSGGGWRSMTASVYLMDCMSKPESRLIDGITCIAGLSGGSWATMLFLLSGKSHQHKSGIWMGNPFHSMAAPNPWAYGAKWDNELHTNEGLFEMRSKKRVNDAQGVNAVFSTISAVLLRGEGHTFVERWAIFLANDLLYWAEGERKSLLVDSDYKSPIVSGDFPNLVSACITAIDPASPDNDWVEFSVFGTRVSPRPGGGCGPYDTSRLYSTHTSKNDTFNKPGQLHVHNMMAICGSAFALGANNASLAGTLVKLAAEGVQTVKGIEENEALLRGAMTKVYAPLSTVTASNKENRSKFEYLGPLRDAGLESNVPFPTVLKKSSDREFDILIVNDSSAYSTRFAEPLLGAIKHGYYEVAERHQPFNKESTTFVNGANVKIYYPKDTDSAPIIVYCMLLTKESTMKVISSHEDLKADREYVNTIWQEEIDCVIRDAIFDWMGIEKEDRPVVTKKQRGETPRGFDPEEYIKMHLDLKNAAPSWSGRRQWAVNHWNNFGHNEGRAYSWTTVPFDFDPEIYIARYPDLVAASAPAADKRTWGTNHWLQHGVRENRRYRENLPAETGGKEMEKLDA